MRRFGENAGGEVKMFRQNRDIRFSPDKSPYKTNTYGVLRAPDIAAEGIYASISATGLVAGAGYYVMAREQVDRYRDAVADDKHGPEHQSQRRTPVRDRHVASGRAGHPLARRARRTEHDADAARLA
jgi:uncharacterized protein (DUF2461 family)